MKNTNQSDLEYKQKLLDTGLFKRVSEGQYTCQVCPFCGDRKSHMYVMIKLTDDTPVLYNCFKCNSHGRMNKKFLEYFNIENISIPRTSFRKKIAESKASTSTITTVSENDDIEGVCKYIQSKVGHYPTLSELQYFQYIGKPNVYANEYLGMSLQTTVLKSRNWFRLTNGAIAGRWYDDDHQCLWKKYSPKNINDRGLYTMKIPFDLYQPINVYIAEGIMDVIGLYYNYIQDNNIYIACMGRNYITGIQHLISMGIFGDSVNIKIFKDSDVKKSDIRIDNNLRKLFNQIDIYQNTIGHDYGLLPDKIEIHKCV